MFKKSLIVAVTFVLVGAVVFGVGVLVAPTQVALPRAIAASTPCPVAGCTQTDGGCHAAAPPPAIDGTFELLCPKVQGCADTQCHAFDRLTAHYNKPSDASMNLWILAPVVLVVALVLIVRKL